jgi:hypothetical protein
VNDTSQVDSAQRYTADDKCPICDGYQTHGKVRANGQEDTNCVGYYSNDRTEAFCTNASHPDKPLSHRQSKESNPPGWWHDVDEERTGANEALLEDGYIDELLEAQNHGYSPLDWFSRKTGIPRYALVAMGVEESTTDIRFRFPTGAEKARSMSGGHSWASGKANENPVWPAPPHTLPPVIAVTAGESDRCTMQYAGIEAFAITTGEKGQAVLSPQHWAELRSRGATTVILCPDADGQGDKWGPAEAAGALAAGMQVQVLDLHSVEYDPFTSGVCKDINAHFRRMSRDPKKLSAFVDTYASTDRALETLVGDFAELGRPQDQMDEIKRPAMLEPGWIVRGVVHWVQGEPEDGKSWLALQRAAWVLSNTDERVALLDWEMGELEVGQRLHQMGVAQKDVAERFVHVMHPELTGNAATRWDEICRRGKFAFVIVETATDALTAAGADENKGAEVTKWVLDYLYPVVKYGGTPWVSDHVTKNGDSKYPVASRAKRAKSKVSYALEKRAHFDFDTIGELSVEVVKNTPSAEIERKRILAIGGDGTGNFTLAVKFGAAKAEEVAQWKEMRDATVEMLREHSPMGVNKISTNLRAAKFKFSQDEFKRHLRNWAESIEMPIVSEGKKGYIYKEVK